MKIITKYKADDGSEHDTPKAAEMRDALCQSVAAVMAPLGPRTADLEHGKGWIQHRPETVVAVRDAILNLCCIEGFDKSYSAFKHRGPEVHPLSSIGRVLSDGDGGPLSNAWNRFTMIDPQGREHQQCYYAYTAGPLPEHVCIESRQ